MSEELKQTVESTILHLAQEVKRMDADLNVLTRAVNEMRVEQAVIRTKVYTITAGISMLVGGVISLAVAFLKP